MYAKNKSDIMEAMEGFQKRVNINAHYMLQRRKAKWGWKVTTVYTEHNGENRTPDFHLC